MNPTAVYSPKKLETLQAWVQHRIQTNQPFAIRGANSRSSVDEVEILSTRNLKEILFFDPEDMVIGAQAGISAVQLQALINEKKMFLPINPWYPDSTIGSVVACNDFGANRMNGGGLRDCIIGIEYINGRGERVKAGGQVVKNVTGYDLSRMMLGSLGGLGVITAVNFKINPQPSGSSILLGTFDDESWLEKIRQAHEQRIPMDWIEAATTPSGWAIGIGLSGTEARQSRIVQELQTVFSGNLKAVSKNKKSKTRPPPFGKNRFSGFLPPITKLFNLTKNALHLHTILSTKELLTRMNFQPLREQGTHLIVHPIGGDFHLFFQDEILEAQQAMLRILKNTLHGSSARITLENSTSGLNLETLKDYTLPKAYPLMKALKQQLDPSNIFHAPFYEY